MPAEHLAEFDDRLHEARLANRFRDERATYSDGWAVGLARRALLEAGRRLAARGALADPAHAVDTDAAELAALLRAEPGPTAEEVAARFRRRTTRTVDDAPPILGPPPSPPPPLEAVPEPARRATLAVNAAMSNLFEVPDTANSAGMGASASLRGGAALGAALREHPDDLDAALDAYETGLRPFITAEQRKARIKQQRFVPSNRVTEVLRAGVLELIRKVVHRRRGAEATAPQAPALSGTQR